MHAPTVTVMLDRPRAIRWDMRAKMRNASLDKPVWFDELVGKRGLYVLCALIWASLVDQSHEFRQPEDIAELLDTPEKQIAAMDAAMDMARAAGLLSESKKNEEPAGQSTSSGPGQSSSSASAQTMPGASTPKSSEPSSPLGNGVSIDSPASSHG